MEFNKKSHENNTNTRKIGVGEGFTIQQKEIGTKFNMI